MNLPFYTVNATLLSQIDIRTLSEWNITEECNEEQFQRKIDKYLRSLDTIVALEQEKRRTKAEFLIKRYRKASKFFFAGSIGGN